MIKFIVTLTAIIAANISIAFSQIAINHSVIESPPYTVGDTITIQYNMFNVFNICLICLITKSAELL
jgi:hypothetical protein